MGHIHCNCNKTDIFVKKLADAVLDEQIKNVYLLWLTFWRRTFLFQILAHPVFKMWVTQKPNKVALWNKRHFEEKKMEIIQHV